MSNRKYYQDIISRIDKRSVEATVSILGISDKNLRRHLVHELSEQTEKNGFLADPVFESMFPWESSEQTMASLASKLLLPSLIEAMDKAKDHKFGKDWNPFKHQIKAWETLLDESHKSLVVTSGTGSGKTECFMVPILNDLAKEYEQTQQPLVGVRALFIYPLNALINSQRERLRAWTEAFDDGIRFCLYNGNTPENKHKDQGNCPNEILTRKIMRNTPASMLVTNATMLEYLLVRQVDEPIIQQSYGKLRWIVLDEAHSYIGSQAAELSLLLRRVMHAFGAEADKVRFVATSATIGDANADKQLQEYLANLAGISSKQVVVVGGKRSVPVLSSNFSKPIDLDEICAIDRNEHVSQARFDALSANKISRRLRELLTDSGIPSVLTDLAKGLFGDSSRRRGTLAWIDLCSDTSLPGPDPKNPFDKSEPFLPVRGHLFHQVLSGLWCCVDKNCSAKVGTSLSDRWPFGYVYTQRRNNCACGSPVFELLFCNDCNAPHLMAIESHGCYIQMDSKSIDEFSLDYERSEEDEPDIEMADSKEKVIIAPQPHINLTYPVSIDIERQVVPPGMESLDLQIIVPAEEACVSCEYSGYKSSFYRRSLLGTPFFISNTVPTLLDACQESEDANDRPNRGRRLITFTDSRQGTARIATKIQQDSERDSIRGLIYGATANNITVIEPDILRTKQEKLDKYQSKSVNLRKLKEYEAADDLDQLAEELTRELSSHGMSKSLWWNDAVSKLHASQDISRWIFDYYKALDPQLFPDAGGVRVLVEMLLLREFARRPKRQNSMETLGLVSVQYPALKQISKAPAEWTQLHLTLEDWHIFLKVILDFYIRENSIIDIPDDWVKWMGAKIYPKSVLKPDSEENNSSRIQRWPRVVPGRNNRLVRMLAAACDIDPSTPTDKDLINGILRHAWQALTAKYHVKNDNTGLLETRQILINIAGGVQYHLARHEIAFQPCTQAWICPITQRLLDSTFKGLTPYLPFKCDKEKVICSKVDVSVCQIDSSQFDSDLERKRAVRDWVNDQPVIQSLRDENLWTDISDRVVEGSKFYRTAEHSAQQSASKLEKYETLFKTGKLNVLSCSTTMEMGVDIGGISVVAMNNVPPHPANYLQRSGRAGRRGESQALSFTICKDNPHERAVFASPLWPFITTIDAPYITLNSERIIQRHINSLLLAYFLKNKIEVQGGSVTSLACEWFFTNEDFDFAPVDIMLRWLESFKLEKMDEGLQQGIMKITKGSILSGISVKQIIVRSIKSLQSAKDQWLPSYIKLKSELAKVDKLSERDPFRKKIEYDLKCIGKEYLLSELASKAFLPGYGFPTGVVTFDHYSVSDFKRGVYVDKPGRINNQTRMRERPSRDMAVAIREYAPGSDVVLDGLVYRSAGILLNKFSPNEDFSEPQKMLLEWRCHACGFIGNESSASFNNRCYECGKELQIENIKEYITPMGFAVDFYSSPSIDVSSQMYVPAQEPWVTANASLQAIFEPKLGSYRHNPAGHIFNHSSGEHSTGFAVCLRCGKAESMTLSGDFPPGLQHGKDHKKLQGKPGPESSAWCEGSEEIYAIKDNLHLGGTDQTDVFELYLKFPKENTYLQHRATDTLPWTLAVVLRQSLADIHGVNAEEMGYTIKPSKLPDCNYPVAGIVFFDRNSGGAGFSSSAPRYLCEMFVSALTHLDCAEECDSACQSCLMGFDTRFHMDLLNRHVAIDYIKSILPYLELSPEARVFGEDSKYCFESLTAEILARARQGAEKLSLFLSGNYPEWDISASDLKDISLSLRANFEVVEIVLPDNNLDSMSNVHKEDLTALENFGIKLSYVDADITLPLGRGRLLAQIISKRFVYSFASDNEDVTTPNANWWDVADSYLVKTDSFAEIATTNLDKALLSIGRSQGDIEIELFTECDGPLMKFGEHFWELLSDSSEVIKKSFNGKSSLKSISYSDSYICSPWSLMLFSEIIDALKLQLDQRWDKPNISLITSDKTPNDKAHSLYAEWANNQTKIAVISEYFDQLDEQIDVNVRSIRDIAHGRVLTLNWTDGTVIYVRLDHGVGCWSTAGKPSRWINVQEKPETQVECMFEILRNISVRYSKKFPTQIFIKEVAS